MTKRKKPMKKSNTAPKKKTRKSAKSNNNSFITRFNAASRLSRLMIFVSLFAAVAGGYYLFASFALNPNASDKAHERAVIPFQDDPVRGLHWAGLKANQHSALCGGQLLEVIDATGNAVACTHGPDPAPENVDVRVSTKPVVTGEDDGTATETTSGGTATTTSGSLTCDGDGTSGKRVQVLYVHASDVPSRYGTYSASFQTWVANINNVFVESGLQTGSARNVRFVADNNCNAIVTDVTVPSTGDDSFGNTVSAVKSLGFNRTDRKYIMWVDATVYCGIGDIRWDDSAGSNNANNGGPSYGRVDSGCWGLFKPVEAHEIMHSLGGVQLSAPHTTGGGHCTDEYDRMCYNDGVAGSGIVMTYPCTSTSYERLFDCNDDDYFSTNPLTGSYLATHWNAANSVFLFGAGGSTEPTPTPPPPTGDTILPVVTISKPANGSAVGNKLAIAATATDDVRVVKMQIFIDGILKSSSTTGSVSYSWSSRKASIGNHTITVKAYDAAGNFGQASVTVIK
jgi:hypothetical protein